MAAASGPGGNLDNPVCSRNLRPAHKKRRLFGRNKQPRIRQEPGDYDCQIYEAFLLAASARSGLRPAFACAAQQGAAVYRRRNHFRNRGIAADCNRDFLCF